MISVIVPVYNVAPYLAACIDSILAQTLTDLELLLVDDGSTDGSGDICDDYACRDARVTAMHQSNAGPSAARNAALDVAQGDFVAFVDSDDVIHSRYLELLHGLITEADDIDIVQAPYQIVPDAQRARYGHERLAAALPACNKRCELTPRQALEAMLYQTGTADSSPCKLFRRTLFEGLRFPVAFRVYEDLYLMAQLYPRIRRMVWVDVPIYFYFKQDGGTLNSQSIKRQDAFDVLQTLEAQYLVTGQTALVRAARERRFSVAMNILRLLSRQPHTDQNVLMARRCWQHILALRAESLRDPRARLKNRLAAASTYLLTLFHKP